MPVMIYAGNFMKNVDQYVCRGCARRWDEIVGMIDSFPPCLSWVVEIRFQKSLSPFLYRFEHFEIRQTKWSRIFLTRMSASRTCDFTPFSLSFSCLSTTRPDVRHVRYAISASPQQRMPCHYRMPSLATLVNYFLISALLGWKVFNLKFVTTLKFNRFDVLFAGLSSSSCEKAHKFRDFPTSSLLSTLSNRARSPFSPTRILFHSSRKRGSL